MNFIQLRCVQNFLVFAFFAILSQARSEAATVTLAWDPSTDADVASYKLYYRPLSTTTLTIVDAGLATSRQVTLDDGGLAYAFWVTAMNSQGKESDPSEAARFYIGPDTALLVAWDPTPKAGLRNYTLYYGEAGGAATSINATTNIATLMTNLIGGRTYFFYAAAFSQSGAVMDNYPQMSYTMPASGTPQPLYLERTKNPPQVTLTSPTHGSTYASPGTVPLAVSVSDPDGTVDRVEYFYGTSRILTVTTPPFSGQWVNPPLGSYPLTAWVYDNDELSAFSGAPVNVTITDGGGIPLAPANLVAAPQSTSAILLTWANTATNELGYYVYRALVGGAFTRVSSLPANSTSFSSSGLASATTYQFRVTAYNTVGESDAATATATTLSAGGGGALLPPTGVAVQGTNGLVRLTWVQSPSAGIAFYRVRYQPVTGGAITVVNPGLVTSAIINLGAVVQNYRFWVTSVTAAGVESANSALVTYYRDPANSLRVIWDATPKANFRNYSIYYGLTGAPASSINAGTNLTLLLTNLLPSRTYNFYAASFNTAGAVLDQYSTVIATTTAAGGGLPVNLERQNSAPLITMTSPTNGAVFQVNAPIPLAVSTSDSDGTITAVDYYHSNTRILTVSGAPFAGTMFITAPGSYALSAHAWDNAGGGKRSATVNVTVSAGTGAPTAPGSLTATALSTSTIRLNWADLSSNESGFYVYRALAGGAFARIATLAANAVTYTSSGLAANTAYSYRVTAFNGTGESTGPTVNATTLPTLPATPTSLTATVLTPTSIRLNWTDAASTESGYYVYRALLGGAFSRIATLSSNITTYTSSPVVAGTAYSYRVSSFNAAGESAPATVNATTPPGAPATPTGLTATVLTPTSIRLNWTDAASTESGYYIYRALLGGAFTRIATLSANVTTYTSSPLTPQTAYSYRVSSFNASGESAPATVNATTPPLAPAAPTGLTAAALDATSISLAWSDPSANESGFYIYRALAGGSFIRIATLSSNTTAYVSSGLTAGTAYSYRVSAFNVTGESAFAEADAATLSDVPAAPAELAATVENSTSIWLTWSDLSANETGFKIYRALSGGSFSEIATVGPGAINYFCTGLSPETAYSFQVTAFNPSGESAPAAVDAATFPAVPLPPSGLAVEGTNAVVQATWLPSPTLNVAAYRVYYRLQSGTTVLSFDAGLATNAVIDLASTQPHVLWATAINSESAESAPSETVDYSQGPDGSLRISWEPTAKSGLRNYVLYYNQVGSPPISLNTGTNNYALVLNLVPGRTYFFYAAAVNLSGAGIENYQQAFFVAPAGGGTQHLFLLRQNSPPQVTLTSPASGTVFFAPGTIPLTVSVLDTDGFITRVEYYSGSTRLMTVTNAPFSATWDDVPVGNYTLSALAYDNTGAYRYSTAVGVSVSAAPAPPNSPSNLLADAQSPSAITLAWLDQSANEAGFYIYRAPSGGAFARIATVGPNLTAFLDTGLASETSYDYRVSAYNAGGESAPVTASAATFPLPPPAPANLAAQSSNLVVNLAWDPAPRAAAYHVYRGLAEAGPFVWLNFTLDAGYSDTAVTNGVTYYYTVSAENDGGVSDPSVVVSATPDEPPAAPTLTAATAQAGGIRLEWDDNSNNETLFQVERSTDNFNFSPVLDVVAESTSATDPTALPGTPYSYRIRAVNAAGSSVSNALPINSL